MFSGSTKLAILLATALFVLVVDTSLMNVSISVVDRQGGRGRLGPEPSSPLTGLGTPVGRTPTTATAPANR